MGGPNLEVFKFGMYIMFPIGIMYYFGANLDARFATPDFWPKPHQTHRIPFEREEINEELERLKQRRLAARAQRLALEQQQQQQQSGGGVRVEGEQKEEESVERSWQGKGTLQAAKVVEPEKGGVQSRDELKRDGRGTEGKGWFGWLR